ncbi:translocase subunit seca, partial [Brachionus plicatilis]
MGKKSGEAVINDLQTGVEQLNTQWSDGLQQFIQLKHLNKLGEESLKAIFMSNYVFFTQYKGNIYGMTGTLGASIERDLLAKAYDLDFFQLPRFKKKLNVKQDDWLVANKCQWLEKINHDVDLHVSENRVVSIDEQNQAKKKINHINKEINELESKIDDLKKKDHFSECDLLALKQQLKSKKLELQDLNDTCGEMAEADRNRGGRCVLIICESKNHVHD